MNDQRLVYIGAIIALDPIENADFIVSATVVCGKGGKWRGIVKKDMFGLGDLCIVFLPDSIIPQHEEMSFMKDSNWRVIMRKFRGSPSEVVIIPRQHDLVEFVVGTDITQLFGVTKYFKPVPVHLQGLAKGDFPKFIPKTDEPNYQREDSGINELVGKPYYISLKYDGSSTTAYKYKGEFGICSRNLELVRNEQNGYWKVALKYDLENKLPEGYALQWETCGPGIQSNPMGLKEIDGWAFSAYCIHEHRYLEMHEFHMLCVDLGFTNANIIGFGECFENKDLDTLSDVKYPNNKPAEGIVIRSQKNFGGKPISFKVINLSYGK